MTRFDHSINAEIRFEFEGAALTGIIKHIDQDDLLVEYQDRYFSVTPDGVVELHHGNLKPLKHKTNKNTMLLQTIQDVLKQKAGDDANPSWVDKPFMARIAHLKVEESKKGTIYHKASLQDPDDPKIKIAATIFGLAGAKKLDGLVCKFSGKGMTRTSYDWTFEGKSGTTQQVSIGKTAIIDPMEDQDSPAPQQQSQSRPQSTSQSPVRMSTSTVDDRIESYVKIFNMVSGTSGLAGLTEDNRKDISTTLFLSFKADYGKHGDPVFRGDAPAPSTEKSEADLWNEPAPGNVIPMKDGWKEFIWPKTGIALGKESDELLRKRCLWAMTPKSRNSTDPETVRAVNALNDMMAARKWDAQVFLEDALIEHGVDGDAFDEWSKKKFKSVARSEENNIWCIENIAAIKDECMDQIPY